MEEIAAAYGLADKYRTIARYQLPAAAFSLEPTQPGRSRFGGPPLLPPGFDWPTYVPRTLDFGQQPAQVQAGPRTLDFLLEIDLADVARFELGHSLPQAGLLAFFYDAENQPWGYDPSELGGSRVIYLEPGPLVETFAPREPAFAGRRLAFWQTQTLPHAGSRAFDALDAETRLPDGYSNFCDAFERKDYPEGSGRHRLFGHSANVQGDMQLEAQLVTNGLYCGDATGYEDARRSTLEASCEDWTLLLQLDTDESVNMMWGDCGTLFYWIRKQDLAARRFDRCWMTLQCG